MIAKYENAKSKKCVKDKKVSFKKSLNNADEYLQKLLAFVNMT